MEKIRVNHLRDHVEQKYRAKLYRVWRTGVLLTILLLGGILISTPEKTQASVWQANSVETIKAKLKEGQNSYTFEAGDTFYNIGLAVNVKWQTLMELNGFEEGSQYTIPVGTTIKFDGTKLTVIDENGSVIGERELTEKDKIDPAKPFANQTLNPTQSEKAQKPQTNTADKKTSNAGNSGQAAAANEPTNQTVKPIDKAQAEKEKQAAEAERQQAAKEKQAAEKERQEAERLKQAAEQRLTEALNKENDKAYRELEAKQAAAAVKVAEAQANYDGLTTQLIGVEQKVTEAQAAQQAAQTALSTAQTTINTASLNQANAQQRVNDVSAQISVLQDQAGDDTTIQVQLEQLTQQLAAAQGELNAYGAQLAAAQQAVGNAQATYNAAETAFNSAVAEKASIETAIVQAQNTLAAAQQVLADFPNPSTAAISEEAKKIQAELAQYDSRITALDQQINDLSNKIQTLNDRIALLDQIIEGVITEANTVETKGQEAGDSAADTENHIGKASDAAEEVENNLPHIPVNVDKFVTIMVDEEGNTITDTAGYVKVTESQPVKSVETQANGDTVTTYTTTETYHKIVNTEKEVIINVDEAGNVLNNLAGYFKIKESEPVKSVEELANGDTVTTYTITVTYHKIVNTEKEVIINVDEAGNVLGNLAGYFKIKESEPVKSVEELANGDAITTYTITVIYHKIQNINKYVTKNVDETGKEVRDLTGYEKVSESQPVKTIEELANGDTVTTYTTTITYKKLTDPIIEAIKSANDAEIQAIQDHVANSDTKVTVEQADKLVNVEFSKEVAKHFEKLVQEEQEKYGETKVSNTKDDAAYREVAERAVEVMYNFSHNRPTNNVSDGTYVIAREKGSEKMGFWTENISHTYVRKSDVKGDSSILAQLIAQQMFEQYIENEREAGRLGDYTNGGHYINIIQSGFSDMALAVFIIDADDYYKVATTVCTGPVSIVK